MHAFVLSLPKVGPMVDQWEKHGIISPNSKRLATISIILMFGSSILLTGLNIRLKIMLVCIGLSVLIFIWSRPSFPSQDK